ncbi:uncharacterized protein LOC142340226 [Convolutriloba macropyga]|uniref:uncharacterized protein LOC142340226 n=1 Tax=Convolutriloba macropyga TaxID=536237 RepID=UPI003F51FEB9
MGWASIAAVLRLMTQSFKPVVEAPFTTGQTKVAAEPKYMIIETPPVATQSFIQVDGRFAAEARPTILASVATVSLMKKINGKKVVAEQKLTTRSGQSVAWIKFTLGTDPEQRIA